MDSFRDNLSYSLPLPVGFDLVEVDHGGRLSAMGGVGPLVVVEGDPSANAGLGLRTGLPSVEVDALILQGPPEPFDEDVVESPALAVHRDPGADPFQPVGPGEGRELRPLDGIHDLGRAEAVDRLVQRLDAKVGFERVRDAPGQHLAGEPVHDGNQVEKPQTALAQWYGQRTRGQGQRVRRVMLVALARKLAVVLWRYVETGDLPHGAILSRQAA